MAELFAEDRVVGARCFEAAADQLLGLPVRARDGRGVVLGLDDEVGRAEVAHRELPGLAGEADGKLLTLLELRHASPRPLA